MGHPGQTSDSFFGRLLDGSGRLDHDAHGPKPAGGDLQRAQEQLRGLIASVDGIVWEFDLPTFCFTFVSEKAERLLGYPLEEWYRPSFWVKILHPEDRDEAVRFCMERAQEGKPHDFEYRVLARDGRVVWLRDIVSVVASEGRPVRLQGIMVDVTVSKQLALERERLLAAERAARAAAEEARAVAERAAEAQRQSEKRLRAIADTVADPVFLKDRECRLVLANPATLRVIGKPASQVLGRTDQEFYDDPDVGAAILATDRRIMESGVAEVVEERIQTPSGYRVFLSTKAPHRDADGRVIGLIGIARDITDRKRAEDALREADRRKGEFLAVLSHELRNPLAAIRSGVFVLNGVPPGSVEAARVQQIIERQTEHLARIVDDLLDVTRISRGRMELRHDRVDLRGVVVQSCEDRRALYGQAQVELRHDLPARPVWIDADTTRIAQVLGNLLQNAAKFTSAGGVVRVQVVLRDSTAEVHVRDTGVGMSVEQLEHLFDSFAQGEQGLARTQGGLGLGLVLCKGIVELHGGTLQARSDGPGRGSEFTVLLPLAPTPTAGAAALDAVPEAKGPAGGRLVLLIEDNADAREALSMALGVTGYRVCTACDGRTGISIARELRPDVVLCDIGLPDIDGYEVARMLRADEALRSTRLLALSGYARPEDKARAREAGFDAHIAKPPELDELAEMLEEGS